MKGNIMTNNDIIEGATAIAQAGSPAYNSHAGATLTHLSDLALRGELQALSDTLLAHIQVHPADHDRLIQAVPAKILNQYIYRCRARSVAAVERWRERTPDWAVTLERAVTNPERFAAVATAMADEVGRAELG